MKPDSIRLLRWTRWFYFVPVLFLADAGRTAETPPPIQWQASFGGSDGDNCGSVLATRDGGFLLGGNSGSGISGNKSAASYGGLDFWMVKVDASGNKLWDRSFGGSATDVLLSMTTTTDGGFLAVGYSNSGSSGNKTTASHGDFDFWLVKVDATGNKVWDRSFGGNDRDLPTTVVPTGDGNFLLGGISRSSPSGNKTSPNIGDFDVWLVKVDADGNKLWDKSFGGTGREAPATSTDAFIVIIPSGDGGLLMGAPSGSGVSGNKTSPNYGDVDYWLVRLDADGNKLWDKSFGGNLNDILRGVAPAADGGFLLAGSSFSSVSGNKTTPNLGNSDAWLVKVDADGNKVWDKSIGGGGEDMITGFASIGDEGFILAGWRACYPLCGDLDYWLVKVDADGNRAWDQFYGGSGAGTYDSLYAFTFGNDRGLLLGGNSWSGISGNKTSPHYGGGDYWVVKLEGTCTNCPPSFTLEPTNQLVLPGTNVTLAAAVAGTAPFLYQWRFEGIDVRFATNATYSFTNVSITNGHGNFSVVVSNEFGSVTSSNALVFVRIAPNFVTLPLSQIVLQGQDATFTCVATGAPPIYYRWLLSGLPFLTNTTGILTLTNVESSLTNGVRCSPFNAVGTRSGSPASLIVLADFDRDEMWDAWETQFGFNTNNAADALLDFDADGMLNRHEYVAGTNPTNASSALRLEIVREGTMKLRFMAQSNVAYGLQYRADLEAGSWETLSNLAATSEASMREMSPLTEFPGERGFYRVVTPPVP